MKKLALVVLLAALSVGSASAQGILLPIISVSPASVDYGNVPVGAVATADIIVSNDGDAPLVVSNVKTKSPFSDTVTSFTLQANETRRITIAFAPPSTTTYNSYCTIISNANNAPTLNVPLTGTGVAP